MLIAAFVYLGVVAAMSLVTMAAYGIDKYQAARGGRRIAERDLHLLSFLGGWPGAIAGQQLFRHKTYKRNFRVMHYVVIVAHVLVVGSLAYRLLI